MSLQGMRQDGGIKEVLGGIGQTRKEMYWRGRGLIFRNKKGDSF